MIVGLIPAYDEAKNIASVIVSVREHTDKIVVCDDGSHDLTEEIARGLGVEVIRHETNQGYGATIATLLRRGVGLEADIVFTIDGDGQHDPGTINKLVEPILKGEADIVIGSRFLDGKESGTYRKLGIDVINKLTMSGITDTQSGFRAYSKKALEYVIPTETGMGASTEILMRAVTANLKIVEVPTKITYDEESHSQTSISHGIEVVLSTIKHTLTRHPLRYFCLPGLVFLSISAGFVWWTLYLWPIKGYVVTNIALVATVTGIIGVLLMGIGLILWILIGVVRER